MTGSAPVEEEVVAAAAAEVVEAAAEVVEAAAEVVEAAAEEEMVVEAAAQPSPVR